MEVTTLSVIERVPWDPASIMRRVNDGVFICKCKFKSYEYD